MVRAVYFNIRSFLHLVGAFAQKERAVLSIWVTSRSVFWRLKNNFRYKIKKNTQWKDKLEKMWKWKWNFKKILNNVKLGFCFFSMSALLFVMSGKLMFVLDLSSQDKNSNIQTQHGNGHWWKHLSGHCQKDISKIL